MSEAHALVRTRVCALVERDGHVLLARDGADPFYALPGGSVEEGEFSDMALRRELREELGVEAVSIGPLRLVCENLFRWRGRRYQEIVHLFAATLAPEDVPIRVDEFACAEAHLRLLWAPRATLPSLDIRPAPVAAALNGAPGERGDAAGPITHHRLRDLDF